MKTQWQNSGQTEFHGKHTFTFHFSNYLQVAKRTEATLKPTVQTGVKTTFKLTELICMKSHMSMKRTVIT